MQRLDDMVIVVPGPGDAAELARVHVAAWRETYDGLLPAAYLDQMNPHLYARRWRRQLMAAEPPEVVVAAEGRQGLVGYCAGRARVDDGAAEVSTLYLLRSAQKLGLGRTILGATAKILEARGARSLSLWVLDGNDAAAGFYKHLGGLAVARRPVRGWGGGFRETAYHWPKISELASAAG